MHPPAAFGALGVTLPAPLLAFQLMLKLLRPFLRPHALPLGAARRVLRRRIITLDRALVGLRLQLRRAAIAALAFEVAFHVPEHGDGDDQSEDGEQRGTPTSLGSRPLRRAARAQASASSDAPI